MTEKKFSKRAFNVLRQRITEKDDGSDLEKARPAFRHATSKAPSDLTGVTELRVHGVGGTPPEHLLGEPNAELVAGDQIAGFYRGTDRTVNGVTRHVEAYSWGGLTSRSASRAWWLLLLPFALVNVAGWMQSERKSGGFVARLIRALALSLTATLVLWLSTLSLDMIAYQCGGDPDCYSSRWWLAPLENDWLSQHAGHRLVAGALIPLSLILVLAYVGRKSRRRYEEQILIRVDEPGVERGLDHPDFWRKSAHVRRLGRIHVATAVATLALAISYAVAQLPKTPHNTRELAGVVAIVALVQLSLFLIGVLATGDPLKGIAIRGRNVLLVGALVVSAATLIAALGFALFIGPAELHLPAIPSRLGGMGSVVLQLFTAQQALALVIGVALLYNRWKERKNWDSDLRGYWLGPFVTSTLGLLILDAAFSGASIRFADLLGASVAAGEPTSGLSQPPIVHAVNYVWFAIGFATVLLVFLFVLLPGTAIRAWRAQKREYPLENIDEEFGPDPTDIPTAYEAQKRSWLRGIARWRFFSRLADKGGRLLSLLIAAGVFSAVVGLTIRLWFQERWDDAPGGPLITFSTWFLGLMPLIFILGVRRGEKNPDLRKKMGILWDVLTVWPRHYHPFAPPCYAERAIPDLQKRIIALTENGKVILSGHSQGAVLSVMTLLQLPAEIRSRVALVTYGSPVTRLYRRFFPAWFGGGVLKELGYSFAGRPFIDKPPRWQNFYRATDPIGGPTFSPPDIPDDEPETKPMFVDEYLLDPPGRVSNDGQPWPPVSGHSHYLTDEVMIEKIDKVAQRLSE